MPTNKERIAKTDADILDALIIVGKKKPLNQITVSDITRFSGISRGTFYLHYLDKDDFMKKIKNNILSKFQLLLDNGIDGAMNYKDLSAGQPYPVVDDIVSFVAENKALLSLLFGSNGDPGFVSDITDKLQTAILRELKRIKGVPTFRSDLPKNYALSLVTNAIMSVVRIWLAGDDSLSEKELSKVIMRALYLSPYDVLGITIR
ncbi:TetR/AcrR family transcriptional regulator [Companilactobacillus baiquanensis]|uniref:TetR/AcrR family transcriptional regulator n=1 Tax=Companilactobacillus baiquanensis TaxID=2486005 RepID=A0ABW1UTU5_9LACO|nr:TetR/AcrR family transcriptional regulator [Companilactobacillus baiquanensis]